MARSLRTPGALTAGLACVLLLGLAACGEAPAPSSAPRSDAPGAKAARAPAFEPVLPGPSTVLGRSLATLVEEHIARVTAAPTDAEAHGTLGLVYEANGLWGEALVAFEQAATLDPDEPVWAGHRAKMLGKVGRIPEARALLGDATERFPRSATLQHQLGDALFSTGDLAGARRAFERTLELAPERVEGLIGLGEVQVALGQGPAAVETLERAVRMAPDEGRTHYLLGLAYREVGRLDEAQAELERGVGSYRGSIPDRGTQQLAGLVRSFDRLLQRAIRLTDADPAAALVVLEECRAEQPENAIVLINLGVVQQRLSDYEAALAVLLEADRLHADMHMLQVNLAACLLGLERYDQALERADRAVALAPWLARAHTLRGRALLALGRNLDAHAALLESARLEPDDPSVHEELGELCLELELGAEAVVHYRRFAELLSESWEAQAQLVRAAVLAGDLATARVALDRALALAPGEPQLAAMTEALAALEAAAVTPGSEDH